MGGNKWRACLWAACGAARCARASARSAAGTPAETPLFAGRADCPGPPATPVHAMRALTNDWLAYSKCKVEHAGGVDAFLLVDLYDQRIL